MKIKKVRLEIDYDRSLALFGLVSDESVAATLGSILDLLKKVDRWKKIFLNLKSHGGSLSSAFTFYDIVRFVWRPDDLVVIGSGDVSSSGVIILLAGNERYLTPNTGIFIHAPTLTIDSTTLDKSTAGINTETLSLCTELYANILVERSDGKLTPEQARGMMKEEVILTPAEAYKFGLIHGVIG